MIKNRLAELLAERNLKISRVANDIPNLSRNTITSTAQNDTKMIQIETINMLCQYLEISPADFFEYIPFDIKFIPSFSMDNVDIRTIMPPYSLFLKTINIQNIEIEGFIKQSYIRDTTGYRERTFDLTIRQSKDFVFSPDEKPSKDPFSEVSINSMEFEVLLGHTEDSLTFKKQTDEFDKMWNTDLPAGFQTSIKREIMGSVRNAIIDQLVTAYKNCGLENYPDLSIKEIKEELDTISFHYDFSFDNAFLKEANTVNPSIVSEFFSDY